MTRGKRAGEMRAEDKDEMLGRRSEEWTTAAQEGKKRHVKRARLRENALEQ